MDFEETMVEQNDSQQAEDLLPEELVEDSGEPEENLESITDEDLDKGQSDKEDTQDGKQGPSEPGYVQKRISKAVEKAVAETEARLTAQFEAQMAPLREQMLEMEADKLVKSGKVKDIETAKELVRYRQGLPAQAEQRAASQGDQPRQTNGQFAPKNQDDPVISARVAMLQHQADQIKEAGGPDVIAEWRSNEKIKKAVIAGEMDFYDVAKQMQAPKKRPPAPMRAPNGASGTNTNAISSMSDEQFARLEKRISEGARYTMK